MEGNPEEDFLHFFLFQGNQIFGNIHNLNTLPSYKHPSGWCASPLLLSLPWVQYLIKCPKASSCWLSLWSVCFFNLATAPKRPVTLTMSNVILRSSSLMSMLRRLTSSPRSFSWKQDESNKRWCFTILTFSGGLSCSSSLTSGQWLGSSSILNGLNQKKNHFYNIDQGWQHTNKH